MPFEHLHNHPCILLLLFFSTLHFGLIGRTRTNLSFQRLHYAVYVLPLLFPSPPR